MTMLTIFQITGVSAAYFCMTLLLPWIFLRRRLAWMRTSARFLVYFMAGNFFCMNLVLLLQLLHISNRFTLILGTLAPFLARTVPRNRRDLAAVLERISRKLRLISEGQMGIKTVMLRAGNRIHKISSGWMGQWLAPRWPDALLVLGTVGLILYIYGVNTVKVYGYCASDVVLHNYWINHMENNHIFVDGVYPFGFHCIIYYLHEVFAVPVYVILRVFALVQTLMVHLVLLAFLKLVCKSKYTPYAGVMAYICWDIFYQYTYYRYYAPLPQEYGMMFILPAAYFAIAFLGEKEFIAQAGGRAGLYLALFSAGISMTLAVHFYDTIVAGLLCVGIGAGFCFRCLRWRYLRRLAAAGIAGILIAALPMGAAYAMGTPLEGSLYWGMNMLSSGGGAEEGASKEQENKEQENKEQENKEGKGEKTAGKEKQPSGQGSFLEVLREKLDCVLGELQYYVTRDSRPAAEFMLGSVGALLALGVLWLILRRPDYGGVLAAFGVFMALLCVLQASSKLGLPQLLEVSRYSVYIGYGLPVVWSLCLDGAVYLLFRERKGINLAGLGALAAVWGAVVLTGMRKPVCLSGYESNGAITCLTNILRENRGNRSWTICSANDEQQMTWEKGYHYETIEFLRNQDTMKEETVITIPTDTVYFFVEKVPILYLDYLNTIRPERKVSQEGAEKPLPKEKGILPYVGEERWVTMSHMYYWAQAFRELYPNEMEVYYETEEFVCYRIRQDGYSLYNFAIDYGYNN